MTLTEYRRRHGLTQRALAEQLNIGKSAISRYEQGRIPEPLVMQKIVSATGGAVTPNDFHGIASSNGQPASDEAA